MTTEQVELIERVLVHIVSEELKQDKTNLARKKKQNAHRHVCFVSFAFLNLARYGRAR